MAKLKKLSKNGRLKKLIKLKRFWAIVIVVILVLVFFIHGFLSRGKKMQMTAQSAQATTGNISQTISASGNISNADETDVEVPTGIKVKKVLVSSGETVKKNQKLATIDDASAAEVLLDINEKIDSVEDAIDDLSSSESNLSLKKTVLNNQLSSLKSLRSKVKKMRSKGAIYATEKGVVGTISVSDGQTVSESASGTTTSTTTSSTGTYSGSITKTNASGSSSAKITLLSTDSNGNTSSVTEIKDSDLDSLSVTAPKAGATPQSSISGTSAYSGKISWDCDGTFEAGNSYTATITLTANDGYAFTSGSDYSVSFSGGTLSESSPKLIGTSGKEGNKLQIKVTYKVSGSSANGSASTASGSASMPSGSSAKASGSSASMAAAASSGSVSSSSDSSSSSTSGYDISAYEVETANAFTIASGQYVVISVSIDELDINSVELDQEAEVTLDAIDGQTFTGTISKISTENSADSGNAKYTAEITLPKEDGMLVGMSASATIIVDSANSVVTVPVNAIVEEGSTSYVYTSADSNGNLSGKTEVTTGLSDGSNVEIKSGLSEGQTVYYTKVASDSSSDSGFPMGGGGGMPSGGGDMPSGGPSRSGHGGNGGGSGGN